MTPTFPFEREAWYSFAEFATFEAALLAARRDDKALDLALGVNAERWMKLRNDELFPLFYFARHLGIDGQASFNICGEGAEADALLEHQGSVRRLQITTAGALWSPVDHWGREHVLHMEKLKREGIVSGTGPFRREKNGSISNRTTAISTAERNPPFLAGMIAALRGKQHHRLPDCELLVYANGYAQMMDQHDFIALAEEALAHVPLPGFASVHLFDAPAGYWVSSAG